MVEAEILKQNNHNFLWINKQLWMWDIPNEREMQKSLAKEAYGNVLVAGYGLGLVQEYLSQNKNVKSIISIEIHKEILKKCKEHYGKIYGEVIIDDFYNFPENRKFDCVIGDIWQDVSRGSIEEYKKFKNKAQKLLKPNGKILAWGGEFYEYLLKTSSHNI